jgi:Protein of unknown function (DUF2490)
MRSADRRIAAAPLAFIAMFALAPSAAAQDVTTQFWPEIDTFVRLNDDMRIYVPLAKTREGTNDSDQDGTAGIFLDYFALPISKLRLVGPSNVPRRHRLLFRAGYYYTTGGDGEPGTSTIAAEATWRRALPWELLISDRNRFDLNFTGGDFDPRYRNRLRLERNVDLCGKTLTPYVYGEFFYSFDEGKWIRTRVTAGLELHIWERVVPEVYFQRDFNSGSSGDVNGVGLVLSIYLR